jgi:thioredoxin-dependent peroxiredoxin
MALRPGDPAPPFEGTDQDGETIRLDDYTGQRILLYFYPHDDTPVCTRQAIAFEDIRSELEDLGVTVIGVSPNSASSHARFAKKHDLHIRLLADPDRHIIKAYDVNGFLGRTSRTSYLIGPDAEIEAVHKAELSAKGHAEWAKREIGSRENGSRPEEVFDNTM